MTKGKKDMLRFLFSLTYSLRLIYSIDEQWICSYVDLFFFRLAKHYLNKSYPRPVSRRNS